MEEMLLVATRKKTRDGIHSPIKCVTLYEPVTRSGEAAEVARAISGVDTSPIVLGGEIGMARLFRSNAGRPWIYVGVVDDGVATASMNPVARILVNMSGARMAAINMACSKMYLAWAPHTRP